MFNYKNFKNKISSKINNLGIKTKLIFIFVFIKLLPLVIITYLAITGAEKVGRLFIKDTTNIRDKSKQIVKNTANITIKDSVKALDEKSQHNMERLSISIARKVADFLYERDNDLLLLSKLPLSYSTFMNFYNSKAKLITTHEKYIYNDKKNKWESIYKNKKYKAKAIGKVLEENEKNFNYIPPKKFFKKKIPLYKEITFYDLNGNEKIKISNIDNRLKNISNRFNTYIKAESYFWKAKNLKKGQIYVSDLIGAYVPSKIIGIYTKEKAKKAKIKFDPKNSAYAGMENPVGKRFKGIIRFVTPVVNNNKKIGYLTMALDYRHLREFTDYIEPFTGGSYSNIKDANRGNYAFMWDYKGRNLCHPREYFIMGFDPKTGKRVAGWISKDTEKEWRKSGIKDLNKFLAARIKPFYKQSRMNKASIKQLRKGQVGLDCRYLTWAPQCHGWYQLTKHGGHGSFMIYWSKVWKLNTAAAIPYYTGKYANSKRGFGIITIGANVKEFHKAATAMQKNVDNILIKQSKVIDKTISNSKLMILSNVRVSVQQLIIATIIMVIFVILIAIWISNQMSKKITSLTIGTQEFSNNNLDYRIKVKSNDELGRLAVSFNDMAENIKSLLEDLRKNSEIIEQQNLELKKMDKLKDDFLANTSHELRTPLHGIIGLTESMIDGATGELSEIQKQNLAMVVSSGKRLLNLVNDILDFSKLKHKSIDLYLKEINISDITQVIIATTSFLVKNKHLKIINNIPENIPNVYADENRLQQILFNLIGNAIKFTHEGKITINAKQAGDMIEITISDTGIGIPEEKMSSIFKSFEQVDSSASREYSGSGLGLAITKQLVDLHGGEIMVKSEEGKGSDFIITLPMSKEKTAKSSSKKNTDEKFEVNILQGKQMLSNLDEEENKDFFDKLVVDSANKFVILIVDDEPVNLQVLTNQLSLHNYQVKQAADGEQAFKVIEEEDNIDLVLLDVMMPKLSGYEVCKIIREKYPIYNLPIIMLTAKNQPVDVVTGFQVGANDYLVKPFDKNELLARVKTLLTLKKTVKDQQVLIAIEKELETAKVIQQSILPLELPEINNINIFAKYIPMESIGGDFYDYYKISDNELLVYISDVSGHGIPAAIISSMVKITFSLQIQNAKNPGKLLENVNNMLTGNIESHFITAACLYVNLRSKKVKVASAGHPPVYIYKNGTNEILEFCPKGTMLGVRKDMKFLEIETEVNKEDKIILYTDGITEEYNEDKQYYDTRFYNIIKEQKKLVAKEFADYLITDLLEWIQPKTKLSDDITLVVIDILE